MISLREVRNAILELKGPDGTLIFGDEIQLEAERYFQDFLTYKPPEYEGISEERLQGLLKFRCSEMEKEKLKRDVTEEEIRKVIFKMPNDKSPAPDGHTSEFFKDSWEIIEKDVTVAVQSFFWISTKRS